MRTFETRLETDNGHSVLGLIRKLRDETATLFRQEVALAKAEASEKIAVYARNLAYAAVGGLVLLLGVIFILQGINHLVYLGLIAAGAGPNLALWLAPMILGVLSAGVGVGLILKSRAALKCESIRPEKTLETLAENKEWIKEKITA